MSCSSFAHSLIYSFAHFLILKLPQVHFKNYIFILLASVFISSCVNSTPKSDEPQTAEGVEKKKEIDRIAQENVRAEMITGLSEAMNMIVTAYSEGKMEDQIKTTPSGLKYYINKEGNGPHPGAGDMCSVHYIGVTPDGKKFDSSFDRMAQFSFRVGLGEVIKGWEEGIQLMKTGGNAVFFIPPHLAYGENGIPGDINGNQELIFLVLLNGFYR